MSTRVVLLHDSTAEGIPFKVIEHFQDFLDCPRCRKTFPSALIQPMHTPRGSHDLCPSCALKERNHAHGLPKDTPFKGTVARQMHKQALAWLAKKEET